jgi:hypothetical protein
MKLELNDGTVDRDWFKYTWTSDSESYCCHARLISGKYYVVFTDFLMDYPIATLDNPLEWVKHAIGTLRPNTVRLPSALATNPEIVGDMVEVD